jgi:hypothetical protein
MNRRIVALVRGLQWMVLTRQRTRSFITVTLPVSFDGSSSAGTCPRPGRGGQAEAPRPGRYPVPRRPTGTGGNASRRDLVAPPNQPPQRRHTGHHPTHRSQEAS